MRLRIFNYDYYNVFSNPYDPEGECPYLLISGRDERGHQHTVKIAGNKGIFRPHFYVEDKVENLAILKELGLEYEKWPYPAVYNEDEKVLIVYTQYPFEVRTFREAFEHTYEADVNYEKMFIMKLGLEGGYLECPKKEWVEPEEVKPIPEDKHFYIEPRVFYIDIETAPIIPENGWELDNQTIISLVVYDNYDNEYNTFEHDSRNEDYWSEERTVTNQLKHENMPLESKEIIHHFKNEKEMLRKFFEVFKKRPDAVFTFNGHGGYVLTSVKSKSIRVWRNGFDEPVIHIRGLNLGLIKEMQEMSPLPKFKNKYGHYYGVYKRGKSDKYEVVIRGTTPLDFYYAEPLMRYTEKYRDFFGRSLEAYLSYFGKVGGKVKHEGLTVSELKDVDLYKELYYNRVDVEGCRFLDVKFGFSDDIFDTVSLSLVNGIDVLSATKIHDFIILNESQNYCVYDTKYQAWKRKKWGGYLKSKVGGYNVPIKRGIYGWTVVFDFAGLYPNLSSAANAGIDTKISPVEETDEYIIDPKGKKWLKKDLIKTPSAYFRKDKISINKQIWDKLLGFRQKYKDKYAEVLEKVNDPNDPEAKLWWSKQYNLKTRLVNNKYGASGNRGFRNFDLAVYNVPPSMGQLLIKFLEKEVLPSLGLYARGGDTDSVFVALDDVTTLNEAVKKANEISPLLNDAIDKFMDKEFNIQKHNIKLDWEKIGPKFYGHMKKNYLMSVWAEDGKVLPEKKRYVLYKGFEMKKGNRADITEMIQRVYFKTALESRDEDEFLIRIGEVIKRIDEIFPYIKWTKICPRVNIRKKLEEYDSNYMARRAAEFSNDNLETNFTIGSTAYMGWIKGNGTKDLQGVFLFNEKDLKRAKNKIELDIQSHKQKYVIEKLDYLLDAYNTSYHQILRSSKIKSVFVI